MRRLHHPTIDAHASAGCARNGCNGGPTYRARARRAPSANGAAPTLANVSQPAPACKRGDVTGCCGRPRLPPQSIAADRASAQPLLLRRDETGRVARRSDPKPHRPTQLRWPVQPACSLRRHITDSSSGGSSSSTKHRKQLSLAVPSIHIFPLDQAARYVASAARCRPLVCARFTSATRIRTDFHRRSAVAHRRDSRASEARHTASGDIAGPRAWTPPGRRAGVGRRGWFRRGLRSAPRCERPPCQRLVMLERGRRRFESISRMSSRARREAWMSACWSGTARRALAAVVGGVRRPSASRLLWAWSWRQ